MSQIFDKIKVGTTKRSTFDLSHPQVTTSDFGYLQPICVREMVPNDDFTVTANIFTRLAPMAVPTFGKIKCRVHHFFVPNRVLYPLWDSWLGQSSSNNTVPPFFTVSLLRQALNLDKAINPSGPSPRTTYTRLMSNLGLNPHLLMSNIGMSVNEKINAFPFLAYYRIWMDYFADTNIYDHPTLVADFNDLIKDGGAMVARATSLLETRSVCYKKDYFTTAKINPQDGNPSRVAVDVAGIDLNPTMSVTNQSNLKLNPNGTVSGSGAITGSTSVLGQFTIEALRAANSLQRYLEKNNFVGTKLINRLLAHFGVAPEPERLDMAEFIGGDSFGIKIGDVTSTSFYQDDSVMSGLGAQAGKGVGAGSCKPVHYHAKEHGIFMSVMSILPDTEYYQGLHRMWSRGMNGDALDYFTPEFENLGYQELLNKEVYIPYNEVGTDYNSYDPDGVFGYTPRFSDYKFANGVLAGDMLFEEPSTTGYYMDAWHLFRSLDFTDSNPLALNENFVELRNRNNSYDRIFQVTSSDYDHFYFNIMMNVKATRPMDGFSAPSLDSANEGDGRMINLPYGGTRL